MTVKNSPSGSSTSLDETSACRVTAKLAQSVGKRTEKGLLLPESQRREIPFESYIQTFPSDQKIPLLKER